MKSKLRDLLCLFGFLLIIGLIIGALFMGSNDAKKRFAKKIPVEFDPLLKLSCQNSNYLNDDCVTLYDRFCAEASYNECEYFIPGNNPIEFLEDESKYSDARSVVLANTHRLLASIAYEEQKFGLRPLPYVSFSLTGDVDAEFSKIAGGDSVFATARSARLGSCGLWREYAYSGNYFFSINSTIVAHVKGRGILEQCNAFASRIGSNAELQQMCTDRVVSCDTIRTVDSAGDARNFFFGKLKQYPDRWLNNPVEWLRSIPAEFSPNAAILVQQGRVSDATCRPIAASFADAMGIPQPPSADSLSIHIQLDRLYQAVQLVRSSTESMDLFRQAVLAVDGGRTPEAALARVRAQSSCARSGRFWVRFYAARNVADMTAVYQSFTTSCSGSSSGSSSDDDHPDDECPICQEAGADEVTRCRHRFHRRCLDRWLEGHNDCPSCRTRRPRV